MSCDVTEQDGALLVDLTGHIDLEHADGVRSFDLVLRGDAMGQLKGWILLLTAFDLVYWILCGVLFSRTLEE